MPKLNKMIFHRIFQSTVLYDSKCTEWLTRMFIIYGNHSEHKFTKTTANNSNQIIIGVIVNSTTLQVVVKSSSLFVLVCLDL